MASIEETPAERRERLLKDKPSSCMFVRVPLTQLAYDRFKALPRCERKNIEKRLTANIDAATKRGIFRFDTWSWPAKVVKISPRVFYDESEKKIMLIDEMMICRHYEPDTDPYDEEADMKFATMEVPFISTLEPEFTVVHEIFVTSTWAASNGKFDEDYKLLAEKCKKMYQEARANPSGAPIIVRLGRAGGSNETLKFF